MRIDTNRGWFMRYQVMALGVLVALVGCEKHARQPSTNFALEPSSTIPQTAPLNIEDARSAPIMAHGAPGSWDSSDVLNPSVISFQGKLYNYFSGYDGKTWKTGIATSTDGKAWTLLANNPVLAPGGAWDTQYIAANGSAIVWQGRVYYFYQGRDANGVTEIGLATSSNGSTLTKENNPVFTVGTPGTWDSKAVGDPYVIEHDGKLIMYYLGMNELFVQRLGVAESDDGLHWSRFTENPILDVGAKGSFDENGLGEPSVIYNPPYFYMLYTGRAHDEVRDIGWAISGDGVHWKKMSLQGLFGSNTRSNWNNKVICDTTLLRNEDGSISVWFGGGDEAQPAQGLHGQIGLTRLKLAPIPNGYDANTSNDALSGAWAPDGNSGNKSAWGSQHVAGVFISPPVQDHLVISGWMPYAIHKKAGLSGPITITVNVNGSNVASKSFTSDDAFMIEIPAKDLRKAIGSDSLVKVTVNTDHAVVPSSIGISNDDRQLALKISKVMFLQ
jgi:predicted GH43/DUF377 family glycosyl hydrolase